jgi:hypothetical protein
MNKEKQSRETPAYGQSSGQPSLEEELTPHQRTSGKARYSPSGGKHASRKATPTPSSPCAKQRGGVGTPLVGLSPAFFYKPWKINAYQCGVALCRSVPPLVCDASAGTGGRYPHRAGIIRSQGPQDDDDLHACAATRRLGHPESAGWALRLPGAAVSLWGCGVSGGPRCSRVPTGVL